MGLGFLSKFFSEKKEKKRISLSGLEKELKEVKEKKFDVFEKQAFSVFAQVNHLLKEIKSKANNLSEIKSGKDGRLENILLTNRKDFVKQINSLTEKLRPPTKHSFETIQGYSFESQRILEKELVKLRQVIAVTSFALKGEVKKIGEDFNELMQAIQELQESANEIKLNGIEKILKIIEELNSTENELSENKNFGENILKEIEENEKILVRGKQNLAGLQGSEEVKELGELKKEIEALEEERKEVEEKVRVLIGKAGKPLKRLEQLIESKRFVSEGYSFEELNKWLFSPETALKSDQKGEKIKKACADCLNVIKSGEVNAKKDKEKEKWISSLNEISSTDFFEKFFWHFNLIEAKTNKALVKIGINNSNRKLKNHQNELENIKEKLQELNSEKDKNLEKTEVMKEKIWKLKKEIQENYSIIFEQELELLAAN